MEGRKHRSKTVGVMAAHVLLPWIHRVFANLKRLGLGVYQGFRRAPSKPISASSCSVGTDGGTTASLSTCGSESGSGRRR
jgi:hypothetical protein